MPDFVNILAPIALLAAAVAETALEDAVRERSWKAGLEAAGALCIAGGLFPAVPGTVAPWLIFAGTVAYGTSGALKPDPSYGNEVIARILPGILIVPGALLLLPFGGIASAGLGAFAGFYCYIERHLRARTDAETSVFMTMSLAAAVGLAVLIHFDPALPSTSILAVIVAALLAVRAAVWLAFYHQRNLFAKVKRSIEALREGRAPELPEKGADARLHNLSDAVFTLIRAVRSYQEDLRKQYEALEEREKTRREILQNTSHELRTPLTGIIGNTDLLLHSRKHALNESQARYARTIMEQAQNLLRIINDILLYAQVEEGRGIKLIIKPANLADLVRDVVGEYKSFAKSKDIHIEVHADDVYAEVDAGQITRVIRHLLSNAIKFNRKGGRVKVTLDSTDSAAFLTVEDNGMGIASHQVEKLFEGFRQGQGEANRRQGGLGLGLALVKSVVQAHGGEVKVESSPGKGSRFTLSIPRVVAASSEPEMPEAAGDKLVLVYDPSRVVYELVREYLRDTTVDVGGAFKPEHFRELLRNHNPRAVILADRNGQLDAPAGADRPTLLRRLIEEADAARTPVLIVSSNLEERSENDDERLTLPFSRKQLVGALKRCFRKGALNARAPERTAANGEAR